MPRCSRVRMTRHGDPMETMLLARTVWRKPSLPPSASATPAMTANPAARPPATGHQERPPARRSPARTPTRREGLHRCDGQPGPQQRDGHLDREPEPDQRAGRRGAQRHPGGQSGGRAVGAGGTAGPCLPDRGTAPETSGLKTATAATPKNTA